MRADWTITTEPDRRILRLTMSGMFTADDVRRMDHERQRAIGQLRCGFNRHLALCDVSATELSTTDVADALRQAIGQPMFRARRCAMVLSGTLARMQARRVVDRPDVAFFDTVAEAEAWLMRPFLSDESTAAA